MSVTGSSARDLVAAEAVGKGITARVARSASGSALRTLVQPKADGAAVLAVLDEPGTATFAGLVPDGSTITSTEGGDYRVHAPDGTDLTLHAPWAQDAAGKSLATHYVISGTTITQVVDTAGATFPVVADPYITLGFFIYLHFSRSETLTLYHYFGSSQELAILCGLLTIAGIPGIIAGLACAAYWTRYLTDFNVSVSAAAHRYSTCAGIRYTYLHLYAGSFIEAC